MESALKAYGNTPPQTVLDLGTGSGCILIALLHEWPKSRGTAVDISGTALEVARENAQQNQVADRIEWIESNWMENLPDAGEGYDCIVSNPPYITNPDIESLAPEVKNHDPILALAGGNDGLQCYKKIIFNLKKNLKSQGKAFLEIGQNQGNDVMRLVEDSGLSVENVHPDLAGIPRVVEISCGDK